MSGIVEAEYVEDLDLMGGGDVSMVLPPGLGQVNTDNDNDIDFHSASVVAPQVIEMALDQNPDPQPLDQITDTTPCNISDIELSPDLILSRKHMKPDGQPSTMEFLSLIPNNSHLIALLKATEIDKSCFGVYRALIQLPHIDTVWQSKE